MLIGYIVGIILVIIYKSLFSVYFLALLLPMIIDGVIQEIFVKESNNIRRVITGFFGGIGTIYVFVNIHLLTLKLVNMLIG